jgi:hypothetical protein
MEHILPISGAEHISVPYVCVEEYDRAPCLDPFKEYVFRKGWKEKRDTWDWDLNLDGRTPEDKVAFLQTWLYFGLLVEVFAPVGVQVHTSDFIDQSTNSITTQALPRYIREWIKAEGLWDGVTVSSNIYPLKSQRAAIIREYLNWANSHLKEFTKDAQHPQSTAHSSFPLVELSIMAIGETLCNTWSEVYGVSEQGMPTWGPSQYLRERLCRSGWCPSSTPFFPTALVRCNISAEYFFGSSPPPGPVKEHSQCSELICSANQTIFNTSNYHTVHTTDCGGCEFIRAPKEMADIVEKSGIPVMRWHNEALTVSTMDLSTKYVSISHVYVIYYVLGIFCCCGANRQTSRWSDGLGNDVREETNSLPKCQLTRIQGMVNRLYIEQHLPEKVYETCAFPSPNGEQSVGFWMDTLCVPIEDRLKNLRKSAIRMMGEIYRKADRVLVLDSFVQEIPRSSDAIEKFKGIHLSNWHHRLWTLQEAQLTGSLFFQFQDGAQTFQDMTYQEQSMGSPFFQFRDGAQTYLDMAYIEGNLHPILMQHICFPVRFCCATQLEAFYTLFTSLTQSTDITQRMRTCAKYVRTRTTTRLEDETLCVATILNLDPRPLLSGIDSAKNRMERFYDLVGCFDPYIIFNDYPRLETVGYRWAPRSFLHQSSDLIATGDAEIRRMPPVRLYSDGHGLPVQFPGFILWDVRADLGHSFLVAPQTYTVPQEQMNLWQSMTEKGELKPWWDVWYKVELKQDTQGEYPTFDPNLHYVVITNSPVNCISIIEHAILATIDPKWQQPPDTLESLAAEQAHGWADFYLQLSLRSDAPGMWEPACTNPRRIPVNFVCRATVTVPLQGELKDSKAAFEHGAAWAKPTMLSKQDLSMVGPQKENSPAILLSQPQLFPDVHPIRAAFYSSKQKWCIL